MKIIKGIKNSSAAGLDNITTLHLNHLGPSGIAALTEIADYSYANSFIQPTWKKGKIITTTGELIHTKRQYPANPHPAPSKLHWTLSRYHLLRPDTSNHNKMGNSERLMVRSLTNIVTTATRTNPKQNGKVTFTNYNKVNWEEFTMETEMQLYIQDWTNIENINSAIAKFNKIIQDADKNTIPKGRGKKYNPNFTPEIQQLIRQRSNLKYHTALPQTEAITEQIQVLNEEISGKINTEKANCWKKYLQTLNHYSNIKKLYSTLTSNTNSSSGTDPTHEAISTGENIPTRKQQANGLLDHYAKISHLTPQRAERAILRRRRKMPQDRTAILTTSDHTEKIIKGIKNSSVVGLDKSPNCILNT